ncbi:MAG: hypothetical protein AAFX89_04960 [Pseudomonadota bacterium]
MTNLSKIGVGITGAYLLVVASISLGNWSEFAVLKPNEWGDFLAGAFGPLAIFWLVLGFFQQGHELRHSVKALELQAKELKNSVEQQKAMVGITERQLNLDIEVRDEQNRISISRDLPYFQATAIGSAPGPGGNPTRRFRYQLTNIGADAAEVMLTLNSDLVSLSPERFNYTPKQKAHDFSITTINEPEFPKDTEILLVVSCENVRGQARMQEFKIGNFNPELLTCVPQQV